MTDGGGDCRFVFDGRKRKFDEFFEELLGLEFGAKIDKHEKSESPSLKWGTVHCNAAFTG